MNKFIRFGIVGSIGFLFDTTVFFILVDLIDLNIICSRILAFIFAVFLTWIINRNFTFCNSSSKIKSREYLYYFIIQTIGALLNLIVFSSLIYSFKIFQEILIIPLMIGSITAMFFNFILIKTKIYSN